MRSTVTTILLVLPGIVFCQIQKSYTSFIQPDTLIKWAAECDKVINLSPKVNDYSLKKWYVDKLKKSAVTAYKVDDEARTLLPYQLSIPGLQRQEWLNGLSVEPGARRPQEWLVVDKTKGKDDDQRVRYRTGKLNESADSCCGCDEADAFRVKQILTYKNSAFNIYNVFISPLCMRKKTESLSDWYPLCNVAYNDLPSQKMTARGKDLILLNTDHTDYDFSSEMKDQEDSVLTAYRPTLIRLLLQDLQKGKIKAADYDTGENILYKNFLTWKAGSNDTIPVYDISDPTRIARFEVIKAERNAEDLNRLRIVQDHYFDFKNEKLYSLIRSVIIMVPVRAYDGRVLGYRPFCKLLTKP
jgi:hypothetical protein